jgi:hypothetical protein
MPQSGCCHGDKAMKFNGRHCWTVLMSLKLDILYLNVWGGDSGSPWKYSLIWEQRHTGMRVRKLCYYLFTLGPRCEKVPSLCRTRMIVWPKCTVIGGSICLTILCDLSMYWASLWWCISNAGSNILLGDRPGPTWRF